MFRIRISIGVVAYLAIASSSAMSAGADELWLEDAKGCKIWNPNPQPSETVTWSGACVDGFMQGPGTAEWMASGKPIEITETNMLRGKPSGFTRDNILISKISIEAEFVNGLPHGYGQQIYVETGLRYVGEFWEGQWHGLGKIYRADGSTTEGQFKNGNYSGFQTETSPDGSKVRGLSNGKFNGPGTYFAPEGWRVDTTYVNGDWQLSAACKQTSANGRVVVGTIKNKGKNKILCDPSFGAKLTDFFSVAAMGVNAAAVANGYQPGANPADPFAYMAQISQMQSAQLQALQQRPRALVAAPPMPASSSVSSQNDEIAALRAQLAERDRQLANVQAQAQIPSTTSSQMAPVVRNPSPSPQVEQRSTPQQAAAAPDTPLPGNCLRHNSAYQVTSNVVSVANNCDETVNVNMCARVQGDMSPRQSALQIRGNSQKQFELFNADNKAFKYELRYCRPGNTTRIDNCPAPCP